METLTWFLTFAVLILWLSVGVGILREPPPLFGAAARGVRRGVWGLLWFLAVLAGAWGPELWSTAGTDHARDRVGEVAVEASTSTLRTPVAVQSMRVERDSEARVISTERRLAMQLPVALLLFLAGIALVRLRARLGVGTRVAGLLVPLLLISCGDPPVPAVEAAPRPDRKIVEVAWDTLVHIETGINDSLLFEVNDITAGEAGFWVLDRSGFRVAHFDWSGNLRWYAGSRGAGPGELMNPRAVDLDGQGRAWVLDLTTGRVTGFSPEGELDGSISLQPLGETLHAFSVDGSGDRVYGMALGEALRPVSVGVDGSVHEGEPIAIGEVDQRVRGIALQGIIAGEPGSDRWAYAFLVGDGWFGMDGTRRHGPRIPFPEHAPFPRMTTSEGEGADGATVRTRELSEPFFAAGSVAIAGDRLLVRFVGESSLRGRLLEVFDLETGTYRETLVLPRAGPIAAWEDRIVLGWTDPTPRILVLRPARPI